MVKTAEKNFWGRIRESLKACPNIHYTRIENSVSDGFPDLEVQLLAPDGAHHATFELKTAIRPKKLDTAIKVNLRLAQERWLKKRWEVGGSAFIFIQIGSGINLKRYLIPGKLASIVREGNTEKWFSDNSICNNDSSLTMMIQKGCWFRFWEENEIVG